MSGSLNKVQLIGNLGADPEIRYTGDNRPIANLRLATTDRWRDRNSNEQQERTEWHNVVVFGSLAEVVQKFMKKGDSAYFEGRLQTRKWQGQDGNDRYTTEVVIDQRGSMVMLGGRRGDSAGSSYDNSSSSSGYSAGSSNGSSGFSGATKPAQSAEAVPFDDDIPF